MRHLIHRFCRGNANSVCRMRRRSKPKKTPLALERLEGRELFAGLSFGPATHVAFTPVHTNPSLVEVYQPPAGISINNGTVYIKGSANADSAVITSSANTLNVSLNQTQYISVDINTVIPVVIPSEAQFDLEDVTRVTFYGHQGNDEFFNHTAVPSTAYGHEGNDVLVGGDGNDVLYGGSGHDTIEGRGGDDTLHGESGNDRYEFSGLNLGSDQVVESSNADEDTLDLSKLGAVERRAVLSRDGAKFALSEGSTEAMRVVPLSVGQPGADINLATTSWQDVYSHDGTLHLKLKLSSSTGMENVDGTKYNDTIWGNSRANDLYGHDGNDDLRGSSGNDVLAGGDGNDTLVGGSGADSIFGDAGHDDLRGGDGNDSIYGGQGNDRLEGNGGGDWMYGGSGNDSMYAGTGDDHLYGESGNDLMVSVGGGNDTVSGGSQWDNLWLDKTDVLTDASANENALGYVHKVDQFFSISYSGGLTTTPISKELNGQDLPDPLPNPDHSGLTIENFKEDPLFASNGPTKDDIFQGAVGDCYFVARLSAVADADPEYIKKMVVDLGDGTYAVRFYNNGQPEYVRVDADLWVDNGTPKYAGLGQENSIWVPIVEKAYAFFRKHKGTYPSIASGNGTAADHLNLTQDTYTIEDGVTPEEVMAWQNAGSPNGALKNQITTSVVGLLNWIDAQIANGKAMTTGARSTVSDMTPLQLDDPNTDSNESTYRRGQHIYHIDEVKKDANGNPIGIVLRNPYGSYRTMMDFTRIHFCIGRATASET